MGKLGHNTNELTPAERQALFAHHVRKDLEVAAQFRVLAEQKKANRKLAQADGFPVAKIEHYCKAFNADDKQKPVDKWRSERENLIFLGLIPDDRQGDLLADRATKEQSIYAAGQAAGLVAADRVSNYDDGSADDKTFLAGYDNGQAIMRDNLESAMNKANASRTNESPIPDGNDPFTMDQPSIH